MPLTVTPDESEERRRRLYGDLAASGDKAMGYGFDALAKMEALAKDKRATERQTALDNDARAKATADLTLRQAQETREGAREKRDAEHDAFDLEQAKGKATRDAEDRTLTLERGEEDRARTTASANAKDLAPIVAGLRARGARFDSEHVDDYARQAGVPAELVEAEWRRQADVDAEKERAVANDTRALDIREQAAKPKPKGPAAPKPPSAYDQARIDAINEKRGTATVAAVQDVQDAERKLARIDRIIEGKKNFNTGPAADVAASAATAVLPNFISDAAGLSDRATWKADVMKDLNVIIKEQAGAAVSASEMTRALAAELHTGLDDAVFDALAKRVRDSYAQDVANAKARMTPSARSAFADGGAAEVDEDTAAFDAAFGGE